MLPAEEESRESPEEPLKLFDYEEDRVLKYSDFSNVTIIDPGLTIEDPECDVQGKRTHLLSAEVQLVKDSAPVEQVMDNAKKPNKRTKRVSSSISNERNNVDFKKNTGLIGMKIFHKDIAVPDDDTRACATRKNRKTNNCVNKKINDYVKDVLELDVYERIIGKAYDNLKICHKSSEEINVCAMMDGKMPRKVCRSKSLYIPSVEKPTKSNNDVSISYKIPRRIEENNFRDCDKSYSQNLKNIESSRNQNIETNFRSKGKNKTNKIYPSIVSLPKKGVDTKIIGNNNNLTFKRNIPETKNDVNETIPSKKNIEVNTKKIDGRSNDCIKVTSINTKVTKSTNSEKASRRKRKTDDQNIVSSASKTAASISQLRRNTISLPCQIAKPTQSTKSEKDLRVKKKFTNPNCNDQVTMSTVNARITKPTNNEKAIEVKNNKIKTNCYDNTTVSSSGTTDIKTPFTERVKGMKRQIEVQDISLVPKVAASISKVRRNTISSSCQIVKLTKSVESEKNIQLKSQLVYPNCNNQVTMSDVDAKITKSAYTKKDVVKNKDNNLNCNDCIKVSSINTTVDEPTNKEKAYIMKRKIDDQLSVSLEPKIAASISKIRRNTISSTCQIIKHTKSNKNDKDMEEKRNLSNSYYDDQVKDNVNINMNKPTNSQKAMKVKNKTSEKNYKHNFTVSSIDTTVPKFTNSEKASGTKRKTDYQNIVSLAPKVAASISQVRRNTISSPCQIAKLTKPTKSEKDMEIKGKLFNPDYIDKITMSNINAKITPTEKAIEMKNKNNDANCNDRLKTSSVDTNITKPNSDEKVTESKKNILRISIDDQVIESFALKKAACISKRRNTISSTCPENTSSLKVCDKTIFRHDKIIPHYHKIFLLDHQIESKNETDKRNVVSELRLIRKKSHVEANPKITQINNRTNENNYKSHENYTNSTSLSQSVAVPVGLNINNDAIEPNTDASLNMVPRYPLKPFPEYDMGINDMVPHNSNKYINMTDGLNVDKVTEVGKCDITSRERTPVLLHKAPFPNQRSFNNFSPTFPIESIRSSRPSQVFHTNNYLSPRSSHTSFSRSPGMRPWCAPYPSYSNYSSSYRNQYPILNRLLNARAFVGNSSRTLTQPPVFEQSQHYLPSPSRLNSPCSPSNVLFTNNTSVKHTQQAVNITDYTQQPAIHNKTNKSSSESSAIQNVNTPEAKIIDSPPNKSIHGVNISNNHHKMSPTEQTSNENKCNESKTISKKEYSPPILPILSYATIVGILEKSDYDYPLLKSRAFKSTDWMNKETTNKPDLDKNRSEINDGGTQDKKTKISLSEYKRRLSETGSGND